MKKHVYILPLLLVLLSYYLTADETTLIRNFVNGTNPENSKQEVLDLHIEYTHEIKRASILGNTRIKSAEIDRNNTKKVNIVFDGALSPGESVGVAATSDNDNMDITKWWWTDGNGNKVEKEIKYNRGKKEVTERKSEYGSRERGDETKEEIVDMADRRKLPENPYNIYNKAHHWGGSNRFTEKVKITIDIRNFIKNAPKGMNKDALKENIQMAIKQWINCSHLDKINEVPKAGETQGGTENPQNHGAGKDPAVMASGPSHNGGKGIKFRSVCKRECDALFFKYPQGIEIEIIDSDDDKRRGDIVMKWGIDAKYEGALGVGPSNADQKQRDKTVSGEIQIRGGSTKYHVPTDTDGDGYITNKDGGDVPEKEYDFYSLFKHELGHVLCFNHSGESNHFVDDDCHFENSQSVLPFEYIEYNIQSPSPLDQSDNEEYGMTPFFFSSDMLPGLGGKDIFIGYMQGQEFVYENLGPGVNTPLDEDDPFIASDRGTLYFVSNRPGGIGNRDIYQANYNFENEVWTQPVNLGETINTPDDDIQPCLRGDMFTMYFASNRNNLNRNFDIYSSEFVPDVGWTDSRAMGNTINTPANELYPRVSPMGRTLFFASDRPGGSGGYDIWFSNHFRTWEQPKNAGAAINSQFDESGIGLGNDFSQLYFTSNRMIPTSHAVYKSKINFPQPADIVEHNGLTVEIPVNADGFNCTPMLFKAGTGIDIYGVLDIVYENDRTSGILSITQFDVLSLLNGTFAEWNDDDINKNKLRMFGTESNNFVNSSIAIINTRIRSTSLPSLPKKMFISPLNINGNQIINSDFNLMVNSYPMFKGFAGLDGANRAEFNGINNLTKAVKSISFSVENSTSQIINLASTLPHNYNMKSQTLEFVEPVFPGDSFNFSFEIDTLGNAPGPDYLIVQSRVDTIPTDVKELVFGTDKIYKNLSVKPNPADNHFDLCFSIYEPCQIEISISDLFGKYLDKGTGANIYYPGDYILNSADLFPDLNLVSGIYNLEIKFKVSNVSLSKNVQVIIIK